MPRRSLRGSAERALLAAWYAPRRGALAIALLPLALPYAAVTAARRHLYRSGLLRASRPGVPVVVVGNLVAGGTGKTPLVRHLARGLAERGWHPGVVSRGYGRDDPAIVRVVRRGDPPSAVGDEPVLYAGDGLPVAVGADRFAATKALLAAHPDVDVVVADDGLQHYALARDVEIVVVDGDRAFGNGWPIPAGPLREPVSRAAHADAIVVNGRGAAIASVRSRFPRGSGSPNPQLFAMELVAGEARGVADPRRRLALDALAGRAVVAVAGIGHPERFFAMLRDRRLAVRARPFPDHHRFVSADLARDAGMPLLMTEKDAVKCRALADEDCWEVPVSALLEPSLVRLVEEKLRRGS